MLQIIAPFRDKRDRAGEAIVEHLLDQGIDEGWARETVEIISSRPMDSRLDQLELIDLLREMEDGTLNLVIGFNEFLARCKAVHRLERRHYRRVMKRAKFPPSEKT